MKLDLSKSIDTMKAESYFNKLKEKQAKIELKEFKAKRSLPQNSYLHMAFGMMAAETGYTIEEIKTITKRACHFMVYEKEKNMFLRSSANLDKAEFADFIEHVRFFSLENLGLYIPTPQEFIQNQFELLKSIEYVK